MAVQVLKRLKKKGLMRQEYICDLVTHLLDCHMDRPSIFIDQRLSFLIDSYPMVLANVFTSLLYRYLLEWFHDITGESYSTGESLGTTDPDVIADTARINRTYIPKNRTHFLKTDGTSILDWRHGYFRVYRLLIEFGMFYFPKSLGFIFSHHNSLNLACRLFGTHEVTGVIEDELKKITDKVDGLQSLVMRSLVIAACEDDSISNDAVYTLIRYNPVAILPVKVLPKSCPSKTTTRKRNGS